MQRYLLNIGYIGTGFKGFQRQKKLITVDSTTIQGQLEIALRHLHPINQVFVCPSSRTDAGVHALHSTVHVDLQREAGTYEPVMITKFANNYFYCNEVPIKILSTYKIPNTISCRMAKSRTYLYRLAIIKKDQIGDSFDYYSFPIEDLYRCYFYATNDFDVHKFKEAANLFLGKHDFRTFMAKGPKSMEKNCRRTIELLEIHEVHSNYNTPYSWPKCAKNNSQDFRYFNIYIKSSGFLYRQVRRTVAVLIGAAQNILTYSDIKFMLQIPSHKSWNPRARTVPAYGLYLCEVTYPEEIIQEFSSE